MSEVTFDIAAPTPVEALRAWFEQHKASPEMALAVKHRATMDPAVVAELKARAPGETDEERELGLVFGLVQIATQLDTVALLLGNLRVEHLPVAETTVATPVASTGASVAATRVDVTPLADATAVVTGAK